jgi:hypothetical protein
MLRYSLICICFVVFLSGCASFRQLGLYEKESDRPSKREINGFSQLQIFQDELNADAWYTKSPNCITVSSERKDVFSGDGAIHVKWNKQAEDCPWMGWLERKGFIPNFARSRAYILGENEWQTIERTSLGNWNGRFFRQPAMGWFCC